MNKTEKYCPNPKCENYNKTNINTLGNYCLDCGKKTMERLAPTCPKCGETVVVVAEYCGNCGTENPHYRENSKYNKI